MPLNSKTKHTDLGKSLEDAGFHHVGVHVKNLDNTLAELKKRGVTTVGKPFYLDAITRKLAYIRSMGQYDRVIGSSHEIKY